MFADQRRNCVNLRNLWILFAAIRVRRRTSEQFARAGRGLMFTLMAEHLHDHHGHHDDGHGHGKHAHTHGLIDPSITTSERGIWAIKWSFVGLAVTALLQ